MMLLELGAKVFVGAVEQQQQTTTTNKNKLSLESFTRIVYGF